ncbi:hypothetical protein H4R21_004179 [Coemansia helicoidea]|uniref:Uncharacterized protein n=1 Tax=Coemansia helicoidea TaxID=1286919 RepID=A0ACC1KZ97_9FUNG|nr:hypothetical protein H4R21_004179 [Coemansia helicoidea]
MRRRYAYRKYKLTRRVCQYDVVKWPVDGTLFYVHRDHDSCLCMHKAVDAHAEGKDRPERYCRSTVIDQEAEKRKGGAGTLPTTNKPHICRECGKEDHGHGVCPPANSSAADGQAELSKRRRT